MAGFAVTVGVPLVLVIVLAGGCADGGADHLLLDRFFAASRFRDRTALARFSTVVFEPHRDGIVERITVLPSSPPGSRNRGPTARPGDDDAAGPERRRHLVQLSLDLDLDDSPSLSAEIVTREIRARVRMRNPTGDLVERVIRVTVSRAERQGPPQKTGRWIVTSFE